MAEGGSDATLSVACFVAVLAALVALVITVLKMSKSGEAGEEAAAPRQRPRQRGALDWMQRGAAAAADDEDEDDDDNAADADRAGRKNEKKAAEKEARRAEQQAVPEANQQRQEQVSKKVEKYNAKLAAKEAERLAKEEEERKAREEKEKKEQEEFDTPDAGASGSDWAACLGTLYEADPTLDPVEYHSKLVEKFPEVTKNQVKYRLKKIRDTAAAVRKKTEDPAPVGSCTTIVGPEFLLFGDPLSNHGLSTAPLDKDACVRSTSDWEVRMTEKTDCGVYAKTVIQAGDFIVREKPLLQAQIKLAADKSKIEDILEHRTSLEEAFLNIDEEAQVRIMQLGDFSAALLQHEERDSSAAEKLRNILLEEPLQGVTADALKRSVAGGICSDANGKTAPGVFMTNAIPAGDAGTYSLCPQIARCNHSCAPNAVYSFDTETGEHYVRAIRKIEAGDEVCVDYFGFDADQCHSVGFLDRESRREWMKLNFGSPCACRVCESSASHSSFSDRNRAEISTLFDDLRQIRNFETMHDKATQILGLLKIEGLTHPMIIQTLADVVHSVNATRAMEQQLLIWTRLRYEAQRLMFGEFRPYTQEVKLEAKRLERSVKKRGNKPK